MKVGDKYLLNCKHLGTVVGVYYCDVAVKGNTKNRCNGCIKRLKDGAYWERMPTVFIISKEEGGE